LFESELFGALPNAHSTATRRQPGKLAAAEGGTIFLDEIGELGPAVQGKLLQFLQSREYYPLGAATNADLEVAVREKRFHT
jgi:transcriptional regulator with PAS, ATPase and Fis domain